MPASGLKDIEGRLWAKLGLQRLADHVKDEEDIFRLLKDLQESVFHYQVRPQPGVLLIVNKGRR